MTAQRSFLLVLVLTVITPADTALGASLLGGPLVAVPTLIAARIQRTSQIQAAVVTAREEMRSGGWRFALRNASRQILIVVDSNRTQREPIEQSPPALDRVVARLGH